MKLRFSINVPNWLDRIFAWPVVRYRQCKFGYTFRKIRLTEGKYTIVDLQDFYLLNDYDWVTYGKGDCIYAVRHLISADVKEQIVRMHRYIMKAPEELLVDHKNGDGLDNRRSNLRLATFSQNMQNRRKHKKTSSKFLGVCFDKRNGKWRAKIKYNGKTIHLGRFDNEEDAARAYDAAAKKYYGEFARVNFP